MKLEHHNCNLNIWYHLPEEIHEKIPGIYEKMPGWLGFEPSNKLPYWFSFSEEEKHITASYEPSGLHFSAYMEKEEWEVWKQRFKEVATEILGFKVGEPEEGEVDDYELEWINLELKPKYPEQKSWGFSKYFFVIASITFFILQIPLIATIFLEDFDWGLLDFCIAAILIMLLLGVIVFTWLKIREKRYQWIIIGIIFFVFLLVWAELAVGIFGTPFAGD